MQVSVASYELQALLWSQKCKSRWLPYIWLWKGVALISRPAVLVGLEIFNPR